MPDPKGDRLYVTLPASEVRRRLKGFGHGVRKVHSAGKGRAVVIHTATGGRLEELRSLFCDAKTAAREADLDRKPPQSATPPEVIPAREADED